MANHATISRAQRPLNGPKRIGPAMDNRAVLRAFGRGEKLDQPTIKRLHREGYIEVCDVTSLESTERELLPTFLMQKAAQLLASDGAEQEV